MQLAADWAKDHIAALLRGESVTFVARGKSMKFLIADGSTVTVKPLSPNTPIGIGLAVLCVLESGHHCLHQIASIDGDRVLIQSTQQRTDGWIPLSNVYGYCVAVQAPA